MCLDLTICVAKKLADELGRTSEFAVVWSVLAFMDREGVFETLILMSWIESR
jgi:hypothetical protein